MPPRLLPAVLASAALLAAPAAAAAQDEVRLLGRAVLPAETFAGGPESGTLLGTQPINGLTPPFPGQPVQGISAVLDAGRGAYWAMPDNGFGAEENSRDFLLRMYRIRPSFETAEDGSGHVDVRGSIQLRDPGEHLPFALEREDRLLTGGDFDIESVRMDIYGDLWFGDEFGPWLLHTDATGRVVEAPIGLPGVRSPQNPPAGEPNPDANLPSSRGFEGTAVSPSGRILYPMLEGALTTDPDQRRRFIHEFDLEETEYTGKRWSYRTEEPGHAIGDLTALDRHRFVIIERDNLQGEEAAFKKVYVIDRREEDEDGFLVKREVADLLEIADPDELSLPAREGDVGLGEEFAFPFQTIESILPLGGDRVLVANDNNFPFSTGRNPDRPDDTELIELRVPALDGPQEDQRRR